MATDETTHLAFVTEKGLRRIAPATVIYDFGNTDSVTSPVLEHTFTVRNDGDTPITMDRIQPSCTCVTAQLVNPTRTGKVSLTPGQQVRLQVHVETDRLQPGMFDKYVWIYADGKPVPVGGVEIKAKMRRLIGFSPGSLEFGLAPAGKSSVLSMTASLDSGLVGHGEIPALISSNPHITTEVVSTDPNGTWNGRSAVSRTYRITLAKDTPAGVLKGAVYFVRSDAKPASPSGDSKSDDSDEAALNGVSMPIRGAVLGDIGAVPWAVVFGSVVAGKSAVQEISLLGVSEEAFKGLTLSTPGSYLKMALRSPHPGERPPGAELFATTNQGQSRPQRAVRILQITLSPHVPPGVMNTVIHIVTRKKADTMIPVYGEILK